VKPFLAKLAFVHRTVWERNQAYRWAILLGPPPVFGCVVAALGWAIMPHVTGPPPGSDAPWAHWTRPVAEDGQPFAEPPTAPLPRQDASGRFVGFQPGWVGAILPMTVDATRDANVLGGSTLGSFTLDQPAIPLSRILDAGPPTGLFVGVQRAFFVARTPGLYAFSARLARAGSQSADCLVRLGSSHHRMLRNINLNAAADAVLTYPPTEFRLEPGLFLLTAAVGCWRGDRMAGPGEMTLLVRHPGDTALQQATADELIRPIPRRATGTNAQSAATTH